jgi:hypothetical protein
MLQGGECLLCTGQITRLKAAAKLFEIVHALLESILQVAA